MSLLNNALISQLAKKHPPRQKKPYSRTKLGCLACKLRKIRCDEGLPTCQNCTKTNRHCERATTSLRTAPLKFKTPLTLSHFRPSSSITGLEGNDIAYLDAFRYRLIDGIVGDVAPPAFKALFIQAMYQEPAIRHAAVAFGAAVGLVNGEEDVSAVGHGSERSSIPVPRPNKTLALRHYDKCIKGVQHLITQGDGGGDCLVNSTLFCALLCICFELRVNKPDIALRHLEHGLTILEANSAKVNDDLILAFSKLDVQATMFLSHRILKTDMGRLNNITLANAHWYVEADKHLTSLLGKTFTFFHTKTDRFRFSRDDPLPLSLYAELKDLEDELQNFRDVYSLSGVPNIVSVVKLPHQYQVLWLNCLILHILLSSCLCRDEMIYDVFLSDFEVIIAMAEGLIYATKRACTSSAGRYKEFHLNMSLLFPIFKTAQLCRSPPLRRRIMALMAGVSFDEGVWQGSSGQNYAEILIQLEEEGLGFEDCGGSGRSGSAGALEGLGPEVIIESRRIRSLDVQPEEAERYSTLFFRFNTESGSWDDLVKAVVW